MQSDILNPSILRTFQITEVEWSSRECVSVPELVAASAVQFPDALALIAGSERISYSQLDCQANLLAYRLRELGIGPGIFVGTYIERSPQFVVSALAILRAGGAYIPLDPAYPSERLGSMLDHAHAPILITGKHLRDRAPAGSWQIVDPDSEQEPISGLPGTGRMKMPAPTDPAYVIYTSGSTGAPKGIAISHANLSNLVAWHTQAFALTHNDRASQLAGLGFDASVWEIWPVLAIGASLHMADETTRKSPEKLRDWLVEQRITISFAPTPIAEALMDMEWPANTALQRLLAGGDTLHKYPRPNLPFAVYNNYGPAECTVVATSTLLPGQETTSLPPIGSPISNTRVYILDEAMQPVPEGRPGEICLAGAGLAQGYLDEPELTSEKFVPNPFSDQWGGRLYRTGDLGRWRDDGQIDFLGRLDDQIKIRGQRIEPDEIACWLNRHPAVESSVVVAREDMPGDKRLVAYVVLRGGKTTSRGSLQDFLGGHLPAYMVPTAFVAMRELPLTANGKVNRAALPAPTEANTIAEQDSDVPCTAIEQQVGCIVASLLHLKEVGKNENFFLLGGHSLLGTQVITKVRSCFDVELSLHTIFEHPTIAGLAAQIEQLLQNSASACLPATSILATDCSH